MVGSVAPQTEANNPETKQEFDGNEGVKREAQVCVKLCTQTNRKLEPGVPLRLSRNHFLSF